MKKYMRMVFSRVWIMLVLAIAGALAVYFFNDTIYEEKYEAKFKLILVADNSRAPGMNIYDLIRSSQMAVGDICEIITSETVLTNVQEECGVNPVYIQEALKIEAIPNTRILNINIQTDSPELSLKLIQSLNRNLRENLIKIDNNVTYKVLSEPNVISQPINKDYTIFFIIAAALGGLILGGLLNVVIGETNIAVRNLNDIDNLFEGENILPVPRYKLMKSK